MREVRVLGFHEYAAVDFLRAPGEDVIGGGAHGEELPYVLCLRPQQNARYNRGWCKDGDTAACP
jgi:hypothetical protein